MPRTEPARGRGLARAPEIRRHAERSAARAAPTNGLDRAETGIGSLDRQGLDRRLPNRTPLAAEVAAWQPRRNAEGRGIAWTFTRQDAERKMGQHHVSQLMGSATDMTTRASIGP